MSHEDHVEYQQECTSRMDWYASNCMCSERKLFVIYNFIKKLCYYSLNAYFPSVHNLCRNNVLRTWTFARCRYYL